MDDAEAVDPCVSGFFLYHGVDNLFPLGEAMGVTDAVFEEAMVDGPDGVARFFHGNGFC